LSPGPHQLFFGTSSPHRFVGEAQDCVCVGWNWNSDDKALAGNEFPGMKDDFAFGAGAKCATAFVAEPCGGVHFLDLLEHRLITHNYQVKGDYTVGVCAGDYRSL